MSLAIPPVVKDNVAPGSGALVGLLVAGPIGALVGAGLGFLFKKKVLHK